MKPLVTVLFQVGMDKNIASLSVPLGQLKEEVLVSVCVESNRPSQWFPWNRFHISSAFSKTRLLPELRWILSCKSPAAFLHFLLEERPLLSAPAGASKRETVLFNSATLTKKGILSLLGSCERRFLYHENIGGRIWGKWPYRLQNFFRLATKPFYSG